jgi:hypothetical protein
MKIDTIKKTVKLHYKDGELAAITIQNGTRKMYSISGMTEAQDDEFWETDKAQIDNHGLSDHGQNL